MRLLIRTLVIGGLLLLGSYSLASAAPFPWKSQDDMSKDIEAVGSEACSGATLGGEYKWARISRDGHRYVYFRNEDGRFAIAYWVDESEAGMPDEVALGSFGPDPTSSVFPALKWERYDNVVHGRSPCAVWYSEKA